MDHSTCGLFLDISGPPCSALELLESLQGRDRLVRAAETLRERIEALEHAVLDPEEIDREHVAAELKLLLAAGRAHRDALRPACAANCPAGR